MIIIVIMIGINYILLTYAEVEMQKCNMVCQSKTKENWNVKIIGI